MNFIKYFKPENYVNAFDYYLKHSLANLVVNRYVKPVDWDELNQSFKKCSLSHLVLNSDDLRNWVKQFFPDYKETFGNLRHKKILEFFISYKILNPRQEHIFMDAAGGEVGYLDKLDCKEKILQDIKISDLAKKKLGKKINYIEGDASLLPLPDMSVDRISCHHSFEHYQENSDVKFINQVQRVLAPEADFV